MTHTISRRTVAKGAAWAAPAVVATTVIPAYAASTPTCDQIKAAVKKAYDDFAASLPSLEGWNLKVWYQEATMVNGSGPGNSSIAYMVGSRGASFNTGTYPFMWDLRFKNVDGSPAVDNTLDNDTKGFKGYPWEQPQRLNLPWSPTGQNTDKTRARPASVGTCDITRSFNYSSSDAFSVNPTTGRYLGGSTAPSIGVNNTMMTCMGDSYGTTLITRNMDLDNSANEQLINIQWGDGTSGTSTVYVAVAIAPKGFAPPVPEEVRRRVLAELPKANLTQQCFDDAISENNLVWFQNSTGLRGLTYDIYGWAGDYDGSGQVAFAPGADGFAWSNVTGNYLLTVDRIANTDVAAGRAPMLVRDKFWQNTWSYTKGPIMWRDGIW